MGGSCAVCSSYNYEGERACIKICRAAWLHALHDSSSNSSSRRSWKGAGVLISSAGAFYVADKIPRRGENKHLTLVGIRSDNDYCFLAKGKQTCSVEIIPLLC